MGKRSDFPRRKNDLYITPEKAVLPLLPHLSPGTRFIEPCAGTGALIDHLEKHGHKCVGAWDIDPKRSDIIQLDATCGACLPPTTIDYFITNPPWTRQILHPIIDNLSSQAPTWLLFDADWMHNKHAQPYLKYCKKIISVGRVKWIEDSKASAKDNAAWYLFEQASWADQYPHNGTIFINER